VLTLAVDLRLQNAEVDFIQCARLMETIQLAEGSLKFAK